MDHLLISDLLRIDELDTYQKLIKKSKAIYVIHFAKALGIHVFLDKNMTDSENGQLRYDDGATIPYIVINKNHDYFFKRYVIVRKLTEYLFIRTPEVFDDYSSKEVVATCNTIARDILVPKELFLKVVCQSYRYYFIRFLLKFGFIDYDEYCNRKDLIIAKYFKVPSKIITLRKNELLGII